MARGAHNKPASDYRVPAKEIEHVVAHETTTFLRGGPRLIDAFDLDGRASSTVEDVGIRARHLASNLETALPSSRREVIGQIIESVELAGEEIRIALRREALLNDDDERAGNAARELSVGTGHSLRDGQSRRGRRCERQGRAE